MVVDAGMQKKQEREWMTPLEIAKQYGVSRDTVYRMIREQGLEATRFGSQWRINKNTLKKWLATHTKGELEAP